jgi:hypothetical protein
MSRARDNANNWAADITGVTAGTGITGGGTSGTVTVTNEMATTIDAKGDLVVGSGADAFVRVAVGSNNQVLTADSATTSGVKWSTFDGLPSQTSQSGKYLTTDGTTASWGTVDAGGMTLINTTTFSTVSSQSITSVFNSTYDNYFITINYDSSTALDLRMRLRTTSDDTGSSTYQTHAYLMGSDGGSLNYADNGTAGFSRWTVNTGTYRAHADMLISGPNLASVQTNWTGRFSYRANGGVGYDGYWGGNTTTTTQYTGFTFYPSTGTISGTVRVYGMRNS